MIKASKMPTIHRSSNKSLILVKLLLNSDKVRQLLSTVALSMSPYCIFPMITVIRQQKRKDKKEEKRKQKKKNCHGMQSAAWRV